MDANKMPRMPEAAWTEYAERRPETAGQYQWRLASRSTPGLFVTFFAYMRERGAGFEQVLSPVFDSWNGYSVSVPNGTQWRPAPEGTKPADHWCRITEVRPEGVESVLCPYCNRVPRWSMNAYDEPHTATGWRLECCPWAKTPTYADPRELAARRNAALANIAALEKEAK
jgi:hypothetical protein